MRRDKMLQVLERQHNRIRRIVTVVWGTRGAARLDAVSCLVTFLAFHLAVDHELAEAGRNDIDRLIDTMRHADAGSVEFILALGQLEDALEDHATAAELAICGSAAAEGILAARHAAALLTHVGDLADAGDLLATVRGDRSGGIPFSDLRRHARHCLRDFDRMPRGVARTPAP
jgi:hypothetical protein